MAISRSEQLAAALLTLCELGGAGVAIEFPAFRPLGLILMAVGVVPLLWWLALAMTDYYQRKRGITSQSKFTSEGPLGKPRAEWMELSAAPFILPGNPRFQSPLYSRWMLEMQMASETVGKPVYPGMSFNPGIPIYRHKSGYDLLAALIEWEDRRFRWVWGTAGQTRRTTGFALAPWDLGTSTLPFHFLDLNAWQDLRQKASFVWELMSGAISELVGRREARIWGRLNSPNAPFKHVQPDAWRHFVIIDWERGVARAGAETLYSVHVELTPKGAAPEHPSLQDTERETLP